MEDSFWDIETSGVAESAGGMGRTTAEMQNLWMYIAAGWDFMGDAINGTEDIWKMCCDEPAYPRLAWEQVLAGERKTIFETGLDTSPGWATEEQWQFGQPAGRGGTEYGHPDPSSGHTGDHVYGVNLQGDYAVEVGGPYYLTAGPFDCRGYRDVQLRFARWLNTDEATYVGAAVEFSTDGTVWGVLWEYTDATSVLADDTWQVVTYSLGRAADHQERVYIRWGYEIKDELAWPMSGWNIDDIVLTGVEEE